MSAAEVDEFLATERTCRVATSSVDGPHLTALWFVWHGGSVWLHSLYRSQRWADVRRSSRLSILVDTGTEYAELRGVEICGDAEVVGEVPRVGDPLPELIPVEAALATKYLGTDAMVYDRRHAWLRVAPIAVRSWDFRKLGAG